jgi:hypothetical protein
VKLEVTGNWVEAGFWLGVSVIMLGLALKQKGRIRRVLLVGAGAFLVFGISDAIEAQTGAWWRPTWLLLLKGACLLVLFRSFREYYRLTRKRDKE